MRDIWLFEISSLIRCQLYTDGFDALFNMRYLCRPDNRSSYFCGQPSERNLDSRQPLLLCKFTDAVDNDGVFFSFVASYFLLRTYLPAAVWKAPTVFCQAAGSQRAVRCQCNILILAERNHLAFLLAE